MRIGQIINGYIIIGVDGVPFSTKGSGLSKWTFVKKAGIEFFMKEFLYPTYPLETSPGSMPMKEKKKIECAKFETYQKEIITKVSPIVPIGSNLICTRDFFRYNAKYYKVTEKVDSFYVNPSQIAELSLDRILVILQTMAQSLGYLHNVGIIHGDIKLNNILIAENPSGEYVSKLIDFDNCYFEKKPPENREEVVGDPVYYSPELENYILNAKGSKGDDLTCQSDIFSLGLIFCQYLTGALPHGIKTGQYASSVINGGTTLTINNKHKDLPAELISLINLMLSKTPSNRPTIKQVCKALNEIHTKIPPHPTTTRLKTSETLKVGNTITIHRLKINMPKRIT